MSIIIVNTDRIAHYSIKEYKGLVTANQVVGANLFADMFAGLTDIVGGKSGAYRERLDVLYKDVKNQLTQKAVELGANAVIGFRIDFEEVSGKGKSMFMVTCIGTAVIIEPDRYEIYNKIHNLNVYLNDGLLTQEQYDFEREQIEKNNENFLANDIKRRAEIMEEERKKQAELEAETKAHLEEEHKRKAILADEEARLRNILELKSENLWMMSTEGIDNAEVPYTLKGKTMDEVIINLIGEDKFNEAGKYYMEETGLDSVSSYDYIYKLFERTD